ncbi:MAG: redoxin domain-containing protein [Bacteroidetes bacterium]|nr:redoxin domain-containing protein [Bacteroidota bacterium]
MSPRIFLLPLLLMATTISHAQKSSDSIRLEVDKPLPDFTLYNITHFNTSSASLKDFRGKWLILDFWFTGCAACVHSFPKVNAIHKEFEKDLNWIMIGLLDNEYKDTPKLYEKICEKKKLEMPVAYDSALFSRWNIGSMPYIVMVDPQGIVRFITNGGDLTPEKIKDLLQGKKVNFYPKEKDRPTFGPSASLEEKSNVPSGHVLYRSVLKKWSGERPGVIDVVSWVKWPKKYFVEGYNLSMVPLYGLYNYAYLGQSDWDASDSLMNGKFYTKPLLEICDTSLFQYDFNVEVGKGTYNYSLTIPPDEVSLSMIMALMQRDLKTVFKYVVSVETRTMPVWKLIAKPGAANKLKTKGEKKFFTPGTNVTGYKIVNWPRQYLIGSLSFYLKERYRGDVFVDETGVSGNIDFTFEADMTDIQDIRKNLQKQGLDLVRGEKELKVIVIRDPQ